MQLREDIIREWIAEEVASRIQEGRAMRRETMPTPFAVGPVASLEGGGFVGGAGDILVTSYDSGWTSAETLLDADQANHRIVVRKSGYYMVIVSGQVTGPNTDSSSGGDWTSIRLRVNSDTILQPGVGANSGLSFTGSDPDSDGIDCGGDVGGMFGLESSHVRFMHLDADDYVRAYLVSSDSSGSAEKVMLQVMFLCPRPPS
jgi:hypothetical protein